ncbi:CHAT domain-containing protein [Argonema galeatum]|uniref:CHAT domain-containing protein n=1 Tax=Argonema galeatum TaxID=2942762 RepID=UPI002013976C|nr:CHAT domain-containing protein [Argonema galeatum]MCL1466832.1 CHAT domain-containing protein [Argonema galeatum A003/A1]
MQSWIKRKTSHREIFSYNKDLFRVPVISPESTFVLTDKPRLRWCPVPRATRYVVSVVSGEDIIWQTEVNNTEVIYAGEAPLEVGFHYSVIVEADAPYYYEQIFELSPSDETLYIYKLVSGLLSKTSFLERGFRLLDENKCQLVASAAERVINLELTDEKKALALAKLYLKNGLRAEAIETLEGLIGCSGAETIETLKVSIEQGSQTAAIYLALADLYSTIAIFPLTVCYCYSKAHEVASAQHDVENQTAAKLGFTLFGAFLDFVLINKRYGQYQQLHEALRLCETLGDTQRVRKAKFKIRHLQKYAPQVGYAPFLRIETINWPDDPVKTKPIKQPEKLNINSIGAKFFGLVLEISNKANYFNSKTVVKHLWKKLHIKIELLYFEIVHLWEKLYIRANSSQPKRYKQALKVYRETVRTVQKIWKRKNPRRKVKTLNDMGMVCQKIGQYEQALGYYQRALEIAQESEDRTSVAETFNNIGVFYQKLGQYQQALEFYQQALTLQLEIGDRNGEASTLNNIGVAYESIGDYQQTLEYYRQALAILPDFSVRKKKDVMLNNIGAVYQKLGQHERALGFYQQALLIRQENGQGTEKGTFYNNIGVVQQELEQHHQALQSYQQALVIEQEIGDRAGEGTALNNIGEIYRIWEQYEKALEYYRQSLAIQQEINNRAGEQLTLANIALVYESQGDTAVAISFYQQAISVTESIQRELKIEELKASFASQQINTYEKLIILLRTESRFQEVFNYIERSRARAFLDQLANGPINFRIGANAKVLQKEERLKAQMASLHIKLANLLKQERSLQHQISSLRSALVKLRSPLNNSLDTEAIVEVQKQLSDREKEYTKLLTQLKLQNPEIASLVSTDVATLDEIQSLLDPDTTLIEYFVTENFTLAFIIKSQGFGCIGFNVNRQDLTKKIDAFRRFPNLNNPYPKNLQQLYEWLITPLKPHLNTSHLAIVPHGILHYLPFAALTDGQRYLCDDYSIVTLPSASVLRFLPSKRKPSTGKVLALGNPSTTEPLPALHYAEQEVNTITQLYGTQPLVGADATETAIFSQAASAEILHIAAHGKYNSHNPLFSTLYLAPDDRHDGRLEVHDIYGLDLTSATNLVVLSACQTQLGELSKGDEVVGLNRAFLYAGTPSVMASLWSVDDKVTGLLMERFYTHLRSGMTKAIALRQAQMDIRAEYPHPYYWAAFVLVGDGGSMNNNQ